MPRTGEWLDGDRESELDYVTRRTGIDNGSNEEEDRRIWRGTVVYR
jgi:hypothetical protein